MKMVDKDELWGKFASYFTGNSTTEERRALEEWLTTATLEEKQQFQEARKIWEFTSGAQEEFIPDAEKAWQRVQLKLSMREKLISSYPWMKIAATLMLLAVTSILVFKFTPGSEMVEIATYEDVKHVTLPDGSEIWLNERSRVSYSENFNDDSREVNLDGEAFFEVKKAEGKRFTVYAKGTKTEVIGTSFNLRARDDEPVKVQVASGKVAFASIEDEEAIFLTPGEEGQIGKDTIVSQHIVDPNYRYWQNRELVFSNKDLKSLVETLEEKFDVTIFIASEDLYKCRFTVSFRESDVEKILKIISLTGNLEVTKTSNGYSISGEGCN